MVGYSPHGAPSTHNAGAAPAFSYTGKPYDAATGLYHFPYRQYDPNAARWLTRDPLGMVDGPNVYAYVMGNPVGAVDPLGLAKDRPNCENQDPCASNSKKCCMSCCEKRYLEARENCKKAGWLGRFACQGRAYSCLRDCKISCLMEEGTGKDASNLFDQCDPSPPDDEPEDKSCPV